MIDIRTYIPGTMVRVKGIPGETHELWAVILVLLELRESVNPLKVAEIGQTLTLIAVDENGDELQGEDESAVVSINTDMYDIVEL